MTKAKFTVRHNYVTVEFDDYFDGERRCRTFFAPHGGGYVREDDGSGRYPQVCERLGSRGSTLHVGSYDQLPALIRSEWRAYQRCMRRMWER